MRSDEQIAELVKRANRESTALGIVSVVIIATLVFIHYLAIYGIIPYWTGLLTFPILVLAIVLFSIGQKVDSLPMLTSGEKLIVLLGRLIENVKSYGHFSGKDKKRSGKRIQLATKEIDSWVGKTYSDGKHDLMSEEHELFAKDLKLVMSGLRKCIQKGMDIPPKTLSYLQSVVSQKDKLHEGYHEAGQEIDSGGSVIKAYLERARGHLQAVGIDDASPEITARYVLGEWFQKRSLWDIDLTALVVWALLGAVIMSATMFGGLLLSVEGSIAILIMYLVGFFMIPTCIHTLHAAYMKRQR